MTAEGAASSAVEPTESTSPVTREAAVSTTATPRKRGRPKKVAVADPDLEKNDQQQPNGNANVGYKRNPETSTAFSVNAEQRSLPKQGGRAPQKRARATIGSANAMGNSTTLAETSIRDATNAAMSPSRVDNSMPKKRGRPKKVIVPVLATNVIAEDDERPGAALNSVENVKVSDVLPDLNESEDSLRRQGGRVKNSDVVEETVSSTDTTDHAHGKKRRLKRASYTSHDAMMRASGASGVYIDLPDYELGLIKPPTTTQKRVKAPFFACFKSDKLKSEPWMHVPEKRPFVYRADVEDNESAMNGAQKSSATNTNATSVSCERISGTESVGNLISSQKQDSGVALSSSATEKQHSSFAGSLPQAGQSKAPESRSDPRIAVPVVVGNSNARLHNVVRNSSEAVGPPQVPESQVQGPSRIPLLTQLTASKTAYISPYLNSTPAAVMTSDGAAPTASKKLHQEAEAVARMPVDKTMSAIVAEPSSSPLPRHGISEPTPASRSTYPQYVAAPQIRAQEVENELPHMQAAGTAPMQAGSNTAIPTKFSPGVTYPRVNQSPIHTRAHSTAYTRNVAQAPSLYYPGHGMMQPAPGPYHSPFHQQSLTQHPVQPLWYVQPYSPSSYALPYISHSAQQSTPKQPTSEAETVTKDLLPRGPSQPPPNMLEQRPKVSPAPPDTENPVMPRISMPFVPIAITHPAAERIVTERLTPVEVRKSSQNHLSTNEGQIDGTSKSQATEAKPSDDAQPETALKTTKARTRKAGKAVPGKEIDTIATEKSAEDEQLEEGISAAAEIPLRAFDFRLGAVLGGSPGNLCTSKDDDLLKFFENKDLSTPLMLRIAHVPKHPNISKSGPHFMALNLTAKDMDAEAQTTYEFRFLESAITTANDIRAKVSADLLALGIESGKPTRSNRSSFRITPETPPKREKKFKCEKCGKAWLNNEGIKYHLTKAQVTCNPNYIPPPESPEPPAAIAPTPSKKQTCATTMVGDDKIDSSGKSSKNHEKRKRISAANDEHQDERVKRSRRSTTRDRSQGPDSRLERQPHVSNNITGVDGNVVRTSSSASELRAPGTGPVDPFVGKDVETLFKIDWQKSKSKNTINDEARRYRDIVMYVIEQNGGVFPGKRGIWYALTLEHFRQDPRAKLLRSIVSNTAVKSLVDAGKIRAISFKFRSPRGGMLDRQVLTKPDVDPLSPAVTAAKQKIEEHAPDHYCPPEWSVPIHVKARLDSLEGNFAFTGKHNPNKLVYNETPVVILPEDEPQVREVRKKEAVADDPGSNRKSARGRTIKQPVRFAEAASQNDVIQSIEAIDSDGHHSASDPMEYEMDIETITMTDNFAIPLTYMQAAGRPTWSYQPSGHGYVAVKPAAKRYVSQAKGGRLSSFGAVVNGRKRKANHDVSPALSLASPSKKAAKSSAKTMSLEFLPREIHNCMNVGLDTLPTDFGLAPPEYKKSIFHCSISGCGRAIPGSGFSRAQDAWWHLTQVHGLKKETSNALVSWKPQPAFVLKQPTPETEALHEYIQKELLTRLPIAGSTDDLAFLQSIDSIVRWEIEEGAQALRSGCPDPFGDFVNHLCPAFSSDEKVKVEKATWSSSTAFDVYTLPYHQLDGIEHFGEMTFSGGSALKQVTTVTTRSESTPAIDSDSDDSENEIYSESEISVTASPRRVVARRGPASQKSRFVTAVVEDFDGIPQELLEDFELAEIDYGYVRKSGRRRGYMTRLTIQEELTLLIAVIIVRSLLGGVDKSVDWVIVNGCVPRYSARKTAKEWPKIAEKYSSSIPSLERRFQELFLEAYQNEEVASIDYDNLLDYDWEALFEWAMEQLSPDLSHAVHRLPMDRKDMYASFDVTEKVPHSTKDAYYQVTSSHFVRIGAALKDQNTVPLEPISKPPRLTQLDIAKSWVRANILTPLKSYNVSRAAAKLNGMPKTVMAQAIDELIMDRIIIRKNKGRPLPGQPFHLSDGWYASLKGMIPERIVDEAAAYKTILDAALASGQTPEIPWAVNEGQVLVITNLQAHGRLKIIPKDVPANKMGLLDGGYQSRHMPKSKILFSMFLDQTDTYLQDSEIPALANFLESAYSPPKEVDGAIPLWIDIHGNLIPDTWKQILVVVIGCIALRTGINIDELVRIHSPAFGRWEMVAFIEWCEKTGLVRPVTAGIDGWTVEEWWWLAVGRVKE